MVYSSVQADVESYRRKNKKAPKQVLMAESALANVLRQIEDGDDSELNSFHRKASDRYQIVAEELSESNVDDINSVIEGSWTNTVAEA